MYSLALFCSGSFHLIKHFDPHPAYFHVPPPAARWKPQQTRSGGTVLDTKQKESPHKRKNHMSLWELVIMPKIGWTESYSVGLKCLVHWEKRLSTPRIQLSVELLQKDFTERFFCFVLVGQPHSTSSFPVTHADLQPGYGISIPPLLYFSLLGVGQKQPVIKWLNVGLYARVVILRKNIQAR